MKAEAEKARLKAAVERLEGTGLLLVKVTSAVGLVWFSK